MAKQRGRKSKDAALSVVRPIEDVATAKAPHSLDKAAARLWRDIIESRPPEFYGPGDLPLLEEYCRAVATLIPQANKAVADSFSSKSLDDRDKLVRQAAALARSLRINVASRTRPDTATMRDGQRRVSAYEYMQ